MRGHDSTEPLFCKYNMFGVLESQKRSIATHVNQLPDRYLLNTSDDALAADLFARFQLTVPQLDETEITVSPPREVQIDVSGEFRFGYGTQSVKGIEITFSVPYQGEMELFRVRPTHSNLNPPRAIIKAGELCFPFRHTELNAEQIRRDFDGQLKSLREFLVRQANDIKPFNDNLKSNAMQAVSQRRDKLGRA
jgi:hypothetical protein